MEYASDTDVNQAPPLTKWKKPPTLANLKNDLLLAQSSHDSHVSQVKEWLDNLRISGKAKVTSSTNGSTIVPKVIRKQAEWRCPCCCR